MDKGPSTPGNMPARDAVQAVVAAGDDAAAACDHPPVVLQVESLRKRYRRLQALDGVCLRLHRGERLALLGPNGAGKTTLIRCIAGRTKPDSGWIELLGRRLPASGQREPLGLVPQEIALYHDLTTHENLTAFARFHGLAGQQLRQRVQWALEWTGLQERRHDLVGGFSGGMQRRVNLACGVMHAPAVLLLDEPTVGVDPQSRQRIFAMLDDLRASGTSIVLTTHQLDEAQQRCDRVVIVDQGRVLADEQLERLLQAAAGQGLGGQTLGGPTPGGRAPSLQDIFLQLTGQHLRD